MFTKLLYDINENMFRFQLISYLSVLPSTPAVQAINAIRCYVHAINISSTEGGT